METLRVDREKKQAAHLVVGLGLHFPEQQVTIQHLLERHDGGTRARDLGQFAAPTKNKLPKPRKNQSQPKPHNALSAPPTPLSSMHNAHHKEATNSWCTTANRNRSVAREPYAMAVVVRERWQVLGGEVR